MLHTVVERGTIARMDHLLGFGSLFYYAAVETEIVEMAVETDAEMALALAVTAAVIFS